MDDRPAQRDGRSGSADGGLALICACAGGTERALEYELRGLGVRETRRLSGAVGARGDAAVIARISVWSRIASRVLVVLDEGEARDEGGLIEALSGVRYEGWMTPRTTFAVRAHLRDVAWDHTRYAAQRVKDVVVDRMRARGGGRPDVDTRAPMYQLVLHWEAGRYTLALDASGRSLHRRGYRPREATAPLRETLAASVLAIAHADVTRPFCDPCCGSGTLAIEQAWRALDRAPNPTRRFAIEGWSEGPAGRAGAFAAARGEARERRRGALEAPIWLSDHNPEQVALAAEAIGRAGLEGVIEARQADARALTLDGAARPVVFANLPYGERLGRRLLQLQGFYRQLGDRLATLEGARVALLSGEQEMARHVRLGRARRYRLRNGPLTMWLHRWDR